MFCFSLKSVAKDPMGMKLLSSGVYFVNALIIFYMKYCSYVSTQKFVHRANHCGLSVSSSRKYYLWKILTARDLEIT